MQPIGQIFSEIYDNVLIQFQNNSQRSDTFPDLSANDEHYIDILYSLKKPTLTSFAEKAEISKPASTRIIRGFLERGFLTKHPSPVDKRIQYLELSPELKEHCQKNYQLFDHVFSECLSVLSENEQKELHRLMHKINEKI
ncbi:transcriptional regulator [Enterococcus silesiacus]|uniref:Transcriptional regulator n=1 Tax=Enterococcus silesiacus TaxID=332949 RepID=A0A0S3KE03_9ENTE|nr:MarR family transcriptional regulator [Enterococcus silesiacus]ALS02504.1 transcriptional regulator [Enterococcus silesiacus]OJG93585.1 transcriptional regulator [Enterococcus silesiacus]